MNSSPILIVPGEKKSIFFEIFFKSLKSKFFTSPLILICDKKILNKEINIEFDKQKELNKMIMRETSKQLDKFSNVFYNKIKLNSTISEF